MKMPRKDWWIAGLILVVCLIVYFGVRSLHAETLAPVAAAGGPDWWLVGAVVIVGLGVAAFVWYKRKNPTGAAALQTTAIADLKAGVERIAAAIEKHTTTATAAAAPAAPAAPEAAPGKNGVAGTFTIAVSGNPQADLAAINAQYFS